MESQQPLTILGRGPSWYSCPFENEVWASLSVLGTEGMEDKRYDKLFAFDNRHYFLDKCLERAKERGIPVVSSRDYATEKYPFMEIYRVFQTAYLKNTISYMLALAILQNKGPLAIYGVEQTGEYEDAKPFVTFWLGQLMARGIEYTISCPTLPRKLNNAMRLMLGKMHSGQYKPTGDAIEWVE